MSEKISTPPVPDLARAKGQTVSELVDWFVDFYNTRGAPFNYRTANRAVRAGYKGIHKLHLLTAACAAEKTAIGRTSNADVIRHAAPLAFGRVTQVFDLSARRFSFGRDRQAGYRIPFLFVEDGIIKVYYLQSRKNAGLDFDELSMVATLVKRYLLDPEFYGQRCDVEFVDVGVPAGEKERVAKRYSLSDFPLWSERRLTQRLTLISEALAIVGKSDKVTRRHQLRPRPEPDMPLFD
jgi:hypothetical protein